MLQNMSYKLIRACIDNAKIKVGFLFGFWVLIILANFETFLSYSAIPCLIEKLFVLLHFFVSPMFSSYIFFFTPNF